MKKMFSTLLLSVTCYVLYAQNVSWGPTLGAQHSWITGMQNVKFKPGVNVGGVITYSPSTHWGIGGDVRLSFLEGVKTSFESAGEEETSTINATYLRVPLKATYFFGEYGDKVRPKIYAGPSFGILLGGETKSSVSSAVTKTDKVLQGFDWGFIAGTGFNYRLKPNTWLNVDVAYTNGLKDVTEAAGFHANRNLSLNLGVTFPLGTVKE